MFGVESFNHLDPTREHYFDNFRIGAYRHRVECIPENAEDVLQIVQDSAVFQL